MIYDRLHSIIDEMDKPFALLSVGIPGSGKSSYLKPLATELEHLYINPDTIRHAMTGSDAAQHANQQVWDKAYTHSEIYLQHGGSIIFDATFARQNERQQAVNRLKEYGAATVIAAYFPLYPDLAYQRTQQRAKQSADLGLEQRVVPLHAIERMNRMIRQYPPVQADGFDAVVQMQTLSGKRIR